MTNRPLRNWSKDSLETWKLSVEGKIVKERNGRKPNKVARIKTMQKILDAINREIDLKIVANGLSDGLDVE